MVAVNRGRANRNINKLLALGDSSEIHVGTRRWIFKGRLKQEATQILWPLAVNCYEIAVLYSTQVFMCSLEVLPRGSKADQPALLSLAIRSCSLIKAPALCSPSVSLSAHSDAAPTQNLSLSPMKNCLSPWAQHRVTGEQFPSSIM